MLVITKWWFREANVIWQMTVCGWRWSANNAIYILIRCVIQNWQQIEEIGDVDMLMRLCGGKHTWQWYVCMKVCCDNEL